MKVSVVVCTYSPKMKEHLMECIESLLNQTYKNIEIICIVDGNYEYYNVLGNEFKHRDMNIKLHLNEKNIGLLRSRNKGAKLSTGEIVAFIDDDAVADKNWISELVKIYQEREAFAVGGKLLPKWLCKKPNWFPEEFYWMIGATHLGFPDKITEVRNTFGSNLSFKKKIFLELGGFNIQMGGIKGKKMLQGGETELCSRMFNKFGKKVVYNPNAIVYHKIFEHRTSIKFLLRRAFWQGYSKANMEKLFGNVDEEKRHLRFLFERIYTRLRRVNFSEFQKVLFICLFTSIVGLGYLYGKITKF